MTDREIILESRLAELETEKLGMLTTIFNLEQKTADLERRLEESCAQNVADNYLIPALSQEVDNLKARNAELVGVLKDCIDALTYNDADNRDSALGKAQSAIRAGNVAKPNACSQLCDVTALKEYIRSCIDNFSRHNKDHPEDTTNSAFQFAFEGIMRKIDELCKD